MRLFRQLLSDLRGATAIEYGLIAAIMSVALISGYGAFTGALMDRAGKRRGIIRLRFVTCRAWSGRERLRDASWPSRASAAFAGFHAVPNPL
eukprot:gene3432-4059_t